AQIAPERAGYRRHHDVVDRSSRDVLDALHVRQVGAYPREPAIGADGAVDGRARSCEAGSKERSRRPELLGRRVGKTPRGGHHIAGTTNDLHGVCRPVEQRLSEELSVRWLRLGEPGLRGSGLSGLAVQVEEDRGYVNPGDAVDEAVVTLRHQREAIPLE